MADFGSLSRTAFTGVGSRAVNRDFDIKPTCQGSNLAEFQSESGIRLDAAADASGLPGVIPITGGAESAKGIGIELLQRDGVEERPLTLGQAVKIGKTGTGENTLTLPLRARYIQTVAGTVGAGSAGGAATFTIEYH